MPQETVGVEGLCGAVRYRGGTGVLALLPPEMRLSLLYLRESQFSHLQNESIHIYSDEMCQRFKLPGNSSPEIRNQSKEELNRGNLQAQGHK